MNLRIPEDFAAKDFEEIDGTFSVYLENQLIAQFPGRSQSRTFAKYLNAALKRLGPSSAVSATGFASGITMFVNDAVGATGSSNDFYPPLTAAS